MLVDGGQVADVAADDQRLFARAARRLDGFAPGEHAQFGLGGDETLANEVGEDGLGTAAIAAQPAPCVDGLLDEQHRVGAGGVGRVEARRVAGGYQAVHDLVVEQLALEEGGDEVPAWSQRRMWSFSPWLRARRACAAEAD